MNNSTPLAPEESAKLPISSTILRSAREAANLSLVDAAKKLAGSNGAQESEWLANLTDWEARGGLVPLLAAESIADVYLVPFSWLFRETLPPRAIQDFRRQGTTLRALSYDSLRQLALYEDYYRLAHKLTGSTGVAEDVALPSLPTLPKNEVERDEAIGQTVRRSLEVDDDRQLLWRNRGDASAYLLHKIERLGVFVFRLPLPVTECRGAARWDSSGPPSILINSADAASAQLFTLIHEYIHLITIPRSDETYLCDPSNALSKGLDNRERIANRGAAAALVPKSLLDLILPPKTPSGQFDEWPPPLKLQLQRAFRVSREVIGIRLYHLGLAEPPSWAAWAARANGPRRARSLPKAERLSRTLGHRTVSLVQEALRREVVTPAELARTIRAEADTIQKLANGAR